MKKIIIILVIIILLGSFFLFLEIPKNVSANCHACSCPGNYCYLPIFIPSIFGGNYFNTIYIFSTTIPYPKPNQ